MTDTPIYFNGSVVWKGSSGNLSSDFILGYYYDPSREGVGSLRLLAIMASDGRGLRDRPGQDFDVSYARRTGTRNSELLRSAVYGGHFSGLGLAKLVWETLSFAITFAKRGPDII